MTAYYGQKGYEKGREVVRNVQNNGIQKTVNSLQSSYQQQKAQVGAMQKYATQSSALHVGRR